MFPGTYKRADSFKISAIRGLKIFVGIAPIIIIAAFIEGFLTRHTGINDILRLFVIIFSLVFILVYFVWYPWYLSKRKDIKLSSEKRTYKEPFKFDFSKILSPEEIMGYILRVINQNKMRFIIIISLIAVIHATTAVISQVYIYDVKYFITSYSYLDFFHSKNIGIQFLLGLVTLTFLQFILFRKVRKIVQNNPVKTTFFRIINNFFSFLLVSLIILIPFSWGTFWGILAIFAINPLVFLAAYVSYEKNLFILLAIPETLKLLLKLWSKLYWNSLKILALITVIYLLLNAPYFLGGVQKPVAWGFLESIIQNFNYSDTVANGIEQFLFVFFTICILTISYIIHIVNSVFNYHAFNEVVNADNLLQRIEKFGERNIMFGFEKE